MAPPRIVARLAADFGLWLLAATVFLSLYVGSYSLPATAVLPHLHLVVTLWLAVVAFRMLVQALPGRRTALWASSLAAAIGLLTLLSYYALVIIGLRSWGRVITWEIGRTYARQLPALADALGLSWWQVLLAAGLVFALVLVTALLFLRRFDWLPLLRQRISPHLSMAACGALLAMSSIEVHGFFAAPWTLEREPVSLSLFPLEASRSTQSNGIDKARAARLDQAEDAARASYVPAATPKRHNVILIVVDALRPDHLALFGYPRNTTPRLAALVNKATSARRLTLHASCAESVCGLTSLASARYVHQFPSRPITLTEVLERNGYHVHLILSGDHAHFYGLREMYGNVDSYFDGSTASGYYMNDDRLVLDRVASLPQWNGVPTMFQFHLMSAHVLGLRRPEFHAFTPTVNYSRTADEKTTDGRAGAVNYYDNGVLQADSAIVELLDNLANKGYLSDTAVIVTADHGELLGEHGLYSHAKSAYEEVLRVPFILLTFGYEPKEPIDEHIYGSQVDVAPTILAELNVPAPAPWSGLALQGGHHADFTYFQQGNDAGVYDHRQAGHLWKYYLDTQTGLENATDVDVNPTERDDKSIAVTSALKHEWRSLVRSAVGASTVGAANAGQAADRNSSAAFSKGQ